MFSINLTPVWTGSCHVALQLICRTLNSAQLCHVAKSPKPMTSSCLVSASHGQHERSCSADAFCVSTPTWLQTKVDKIRSTHREDIESNRWHAKFSLTKGQGQWSMGLLSHVCLYQLISRKISKRVTVWAERESKTQHLKANASFWCQCKLSQSVMASANCTSLPLSGLLHLFFHR